MLIEDGIEMGLGEDNFNLEISENARPHMKSVDWEHISKLVRKGYREGEVLPDDAEGNQVRGWWKLDMSRDVNKGLN